MFLRRRNVRPFHRVNRLAQNLENPAVEMCFLVPSETVFDRCNSSFRDIYLGPSDGSRVFTSQSLLTRNRIFILKFTPSSRVEPVLVSCQRSRGSSETRAPRVVGGWDTPTACSWLLSSHGTKGVVFYYI